VVEFLRLPFDDEPDTVDARLEARDRAGRERAVDPRFNVALEASAGTGKTKVLVDRYVNLLKAGIAPRNILAITFTRKAATEMRERVLASLRLAAARGEIPPAQWRELRQRTADVQIGTIDAFCLSLLREFPLEADLDPGFSMADDTEVPRLVDEALDRALRTCRALARADEHVALVFAQLDDRRVRAGLAALLGRRLVAPELLATYLAKGAGALTVEAAARDGAARLLAVFRGLRGGLDRFVSSGPVDPEFALVTGELERLEATLARGDTPKPDAVQLAFVRVLDVFQTQAGEPRRRPKYGKARFASEEGFRTHRDLVLTAAPAVLDAHAAFRRDLNALVARGVWRIYRVAENEYLRTLDAHAVIDFPEALLRALSMLRQMEEFAQSRYRLESRYHHVLVDEFQDTSRKQWELMSLLVESWGHGAGLAHSGPLAPSIFIVGDRKQSIYGFRDAEVAMLREAGRHLESLRADGDVRRTISKSFRARPALLAFVNDVCQDLEPTSREDGFQYREDDRFPVGAVGPAGERTTALGIVVGDTADLCAARTAAEISRLLADGALVRDRDTGVDRPVRAADVAILFRTRDSHREFERALDEVGVSTFVYKGLGFFDAPEIKDVLALLWYLAEPTSELRAASWLRSRFVRLSDEALRQLAPRLSDTLVGDVPAAASSLDPDDACALAAARAHAHRWLALVDIVPPAELLDLVLTESAYAVETRGRHHRQAWENLKKIRARVRRMQNRGYATLARVVAHLERLALGDEANAAIDAGDAVSLMTVHASKGLEFPVVFLVNLARGTGARRPPIRVSALPPPREDVAVAVGAFRSEADEDEEARTREETKRLLYVGLTRARDRLYLSSVLRDGALAPGRGSLAEVLPPSLQIAFTAAAAGAPVRWQSSSGVTHAFEVCTEVVAVHTSAQNLSAQPAAAASCNPSGEQATAAAAPPLADFEVAPDWTTRSHLAPARAAANADDGDSTGARSSRRLGTLVHRLLERFGVRTDHDDAQLEAMAQRLIRTDERPDVADLQAFATAVVRTYRQLGSHPEVKAISADALHEVPFTLRTEGGFVRGTIDCLYRRPDGTFVVLEFKTGRRQSEHQTQANLYREAVQALAPAGAPVEVHVVYTAESDAQNSRSE
jgi:ATP-dependent helicase/nuclease subunit A